MIRSEELWNCFYVVPTPKNGLETEVHPPFDRVQMPHKPKRPLTTQQREDRVSRLTQQYAALEGVEDTPFDEGGMIDPPEGQPRFNPSVGEDDPLKYVRLMRRLSHPLATPPDGGEE